MRKRLFTRTLAECTTPLTDEALGGRGKMQARLLRDWPQIVGPDMAKRCAPDSLTFPRDGGGNGTLTLRASAAHALDIHYAEPVLLERLASYFGYRAITRLRIVQTRENAPLPSLPAAQAELGEALGRLARALQSGNTSGMIVKK